MPPNPPVPIVGRLAPSPTGGLHVGHARTFLLAWVSARSRGGRVILRIEDLDASRVRPGATAGVLDDLAWLGFDWEPTIPVQSDRVEAYRADLEWLQARELVYPCTCTRAEIQRAASAPNLGDEGPTYPGTCAGRSVADGDRLGSLPFVWRFRVDSGAVAWDDLILGVCRRDPGREGGDFLVARSDGLISYQLAVSHDDAAMGVTEILRGDDLVPSTPRQILLGRALGHSERRYGHVPLVMDRDGRRLAKRDGAIKLATLRDQGIDPLRIVGWAARSLGWSDGIEPTRPADWFRRFGLAAIPREPARFDPGELQSK